jgi:kumamolisin
MTHHIGIRLPRTANPASLTPRQVATACTSAWTRPTGKGYTAGLVELGGGYNLAQVQEYFTKNGLPVPTFVSVAVGSGQNKQDGPNGADGEAQSDMIVAGSVATAATFRVCFGGNTDADFLAAIKQAIAECGGVPVSWGSSEDNWSASVMHEFEAAIKAGRAKGVRCWWPRVTADQQDSSGDGNQVDFPASSPSAIGCGAMLVTRSRASSMPDWRDH